MDVSSDTISLLSLLIVLVLAIWVFIRIAIGLRRGGGSLTTIVLGTTDHFLTKEKSKAAETIVNENAGKKFEDQSSSDPDAPGSQRQ